MKCRTQQGHQQKQHYDIQMKSDETQHTTQSHPSRCVLKTRIIQHISTCFEYNVNFYDPLKTLHIFHALRAGIE